MAKQTWLNVGGTWKELVSVWNNVGGVWKKDAMPKLNVSGVYKECMSYVPPVKVYGIVDNNVVSIMYTTSKDIGSSWTNIVSFSGLYANSTNVTLEKSGNNIVAGDPKYSNFYFSTDNGETFAQVNTTAQATYLPSAMTVSGNNFFMICSNQVRQTTNPSNSSWTSRMGDLSWVEMVGMVITPNYYITYGDNGTSYGYRYTKSYDSKTNVGFRYVSRYSNVMYIDGKLYANSNTYTTIGTSESDTSFDLTTNNKTSNSRYASVDGTIYAVGNNKLAYLNGSAWVEITTVPTTSRKNDIVYYNGTIYMATDIGVYTSTDGGATWEAPSNTLEVYRLLFDV